MTTGERLLEIQPDNSEGISLVGEAQAKLTKRHELIEQLEQERSVLAEVQQRLEENQAKLTEQRAELDAEQERLATERVEINQHLEELEQAQARCEKSKNKLNEQLQTLEKEREEAGRRAMQLDQTSGLLEKGELEQAERLLIQRSEPSTEPHPVPDMPPARTEQRAPGAGFWGSLAGLALFASIAVFSAGAPVAGSFFLLIAIVLGAVALVQSQLSNALPHPEKPEES